MGNVELKATLMSAAKSDSYESFRKHGITASTLELPDEELHKVYKSRFGYESPEEAGFSLKNV